MKKAILILLLSFTFTNTAVTESSNTTRETLCIAEAIYREARGEPYLGKLAVGQVVINRTRHKNYPSTACEVVFQKYQFSWTKRFKRFKATPEDIHLAFKVKHGEHELKNFKATHFHANYVNPKWNLRKIRTIGNHIFYI